MNRRRFTIAHVWPAIPKISWVFIAALILGISIPLLSNAQQSSKLLQVGWLGPLVKDNEPWMEAFREGLRSRGYVEGQNLHVEYRYARDAEEASKMAADLIARKVDVIATVGDGEAARNATQTIPIVIIACERVEQLVASIARPGGNVTGMTCVSADLAAKRLQLLQETVPGVSRVAVLYNAGTPSKVAELGELQAAAKKLEIATLPIAVHDVHGFETAFAAIKDGNVQALISLSDALMWNYRQEIAEFTLRQRLPSMYPFSHYVVSGGLMSYGSDFMAQHRRYGYFIDKIAKGAKAGDIPIEQPTKFDLIINLTTAHALGLTIPPSILAQADKVIE
jgi:putative ABC transport system substrate-binding protein